MTVVRAYQRIEFEGKKYTTIAGEIMRWSVKIIGKVMNVG
jgi:hypothetical protein